LSCLKESRLSNAKETSLSWPAGWAYVVALILTWTAVWAGASAGGRANWQSFSLTDGLAGARVAAIFQDRDGHLWVGTDGGGVSRFDGQEFVKFTTEDGLASNFVQTILQDRDGHLWVGTDGGGVSRFDGQEWFTYTTESGLVSNHVLAILQDNEGAMWFGSGDMSLQNGVGASRLKDGEWRTYGVDNGLSSAWVGALFEDRGGRIWLGTDKGAAWLEDGVLTVVDEGMGAVRDIYEDATGTLWFATDNGVLYYRGQELKRMDRADGLASNSVRAIVEAEDGALWFGTVDGISRWRDGQFTNYTTAGTGGGLAHNWVNALFADREGHLWVGTNGGGLSRFDESLVTFDREHGLADDLVVSAFEDSRGFLWFGTDEGGVSRFDVDTETFRTFTTQDGLAANSVRTIIEAEDGALWFGTDGGGVSRFDVEIGAFRTFSTEDGLASPNVYSALRAEDGGLWFGTGSFAVPGRGVSRYLDGTWRTFNGADGLPDTTVSAIYQDVRGRVWLGTGQGLSRYNGSILENFDTADGLANNRVRAIVGDKQERIWFGTEGGVSRLTYDEEGRPHVRVFTTDDGLGDNLIRSIFQDRDGHLWFGTLGGGVTRYDGRVFQHMTRKDGMAHNGVYAAVQDRRGDLWFGTLGGGVTRYRPPAPVAPGVVIDAVVTDREHTGKDSLAVPSSIGLVAFEFHSISLKTRRGAMVYRYRLRGHGDGEWQTTRRRRVEYQDLPAGSYVFEIEAVDRDAVYSAQRARFPLEVYYQPMSSLVSIEKLELADIFASYYKTYAERRVGAVTIVNADPNPVEAKLSYYIPGVMARPTEQTLSLEAHSSRRVELRANLSPEILDLRGDQAVQAQVELSCEIGEERRTLSVKEARTVTLYGRGMLTWDSLGRAAAFVTPQDEQVSAFSRGLYERYRHRLVRDPSDGNITTAMLLFEALNAAGIKYAQDSSSPYSQARADRSAVDNIQYPSELLASRLGDCDDCTVLYCALLENLNIATAFVDAPSHILMMFDSGITDARRYGLRLGPERYIRRGDRFWIPIEVTKLGEGSFMEAWDLGVQIVRRLHDKGELGITDVRDAWGYFPYANLAAADSSTVELPSGEAFERTFAAEMQRFEASRHEYVKQRYILPLAADPEAHDVRLGLVRTKIEADEHNDAVVAAMPLLQTRHAAEANYLIGCAYASQNDWLRAIGAFERAVDAEPDNPQYRDGLKILRQAASPEVGQEVRQEDGALVE
jgi:ligand-binding sensor domain-containing protein